MQQFGCNHVNIVWIDRGILLSIMSFIIDNYSVLLDRIIIINNKKYREFFRIIFNQLEIRKFTKKTKKNFYFNIRKIIMPQDIIIDYIHNYDSTLETDKIHLVPWYDSNDPLIMYQIGDNNMNIIKYKEYIQKFSQCRRGNYNNSSWDLTMERNILIKYNRFNYRFSINNIFSLLNKFVIDSYNVINQPNTKIVYVPITSYENGNGNGNDYNVDTNVDTKGDAKQPDCEKTYKNNLENNIHIDKLIKILSNNVKNIYDLIN
jgi:hypothetical protein